MSDVCATLSFVQRFPYPTSGPCVSDTNDEEDHDDRGEVPKTIETIDVGVYSDANCDGKWEKCLDDGISHSVY